MKYKARLQTATLIEIKRVIYRSMQVTDPGMHLDFIASRRQEVLERVYIAFGMVNGAYFCALVQNAEDGFDALLVEIKSLALRRPQFFSPRF